jgi:hypothetical protein
MITRIRMLWVGVLVALLAAAPAFAMSSQPALEGAERSFGPSAPEPSAALLFAAGAGLVNWTLRRRSRR